MWDWTCAEVFGNPSGHVYAAIFLYEPIVSDVIGFDRYHLLGIPLAIIWVIMPICRMYLGLHSADQVLHGIVYGFSFLIMYKYVLQKYTYKLYSELFRGPLKPIKIAFIMFCHAATIVVPIIIFNYNVQYYPMNPRDLDAINQICKLQTTSEKNQESMLTSCCLASVSFGFMYGMMLLKNKAGHRRFLIGQWNYERKLKILAKFGILVLCAGVPTLIFILIAKFAVNNSYGKYILFCAGATAGGFGLTYFNTIVANKFNIMESIDKVKQV